MTQHMHRLNDTTVFEFFVLPKLNPRATAAGNGLPVYEDVDMVRMFARGSQIASTEFEVRRLVVKILGDKIKGDPILWPQIEQAYNAWKEGRTLKMTGTPLAMAPWASPAMVKMLEGLHIFSVEDVANANDSVLGSIGMGAIALQQQARDWLASADRGAVTQQLTDIRSEFEQFKAEQARQSDEAEARVKTQAEEIEALKAALTKSQAEAKEANALLEQVAAEETRKAADAAGGKGTTKTAKA